MGAPSPLERRAWRIHRQDPDAPAALWGDLTPAQRRAYRARARGAADAGKGAAPCPVCGQETQTRRGVLVTHGPGAEGAFFCPGGGRTVEVEDQ